MSAYSNQEGPKEIVIPETRYKSCHSCKHYEYQMLKSGVNPIYGHFCKSDKIKGTPHIFNNLGISGNLVSDVTPIWCPYINGND